MPFPGQDTEIDVEASYTVAMVKDRVRAMGRLSTDSYICVHVKLTNCQVLEVDIEDSDTIDDVKLKFQTKKASTKTNIPLSSTPSRAVGITRLQ